MKETKYIMKKKTISLMVATMLVMCNTIQAFATPDQATLNEGRQKYEAIQTKINDIQTKIDDLNTEIEPLQTQIENNEKETDRIKNVIDNTEKDIDQCKKDITDLDEALGERVNAMHKSGNLEFNYLTFILESTSTSDFFNRIQSLGNIISKDKKAIQDVNDKKQELNEKVTSLEDKKNEIDELTKKVKADLDEFHEKREEQEELAKEAKAEREKFDSETLSELEREVVKPQYSKISESASLEDVTSAISNLRAIRDGQLKSEIVKAEVNEQIEKAKTLEAKKKEEAERAARAAQAAATPNRGSSSSSSVKVPASANGNAVVSEAYRHLGKNYVFGATGEQTFDCSGLAQYVYRKAAGVNLPRTTFEQINVGKAVSQSDLQPGDLVFPHTGHVGIYIGGGQMIHAPQTGDVVKVSPVYKFYTARRIG